MIDCNAYELVRFSNQPSLAIDQRKHFYDYPANIMDKTITVQYFEESQSQSGDYSLRFPVVKHIHGEKRVF